jgi:hypothetical protein
LKLLQELGAREIKEKGRRGEFMYGIFDSM